MKLEDLLDGLMTKSAAVAEDDKSKEAKKDDDKTPEDEGKEKSEKKEEQEKSAAFKSGEQLAKEIMEKVASTKIENNKGEEMNKQASDAGKALAEALLTKLAGVGDEITENGIAPGVVPNKTQVDLAAQQAEHDASFQATPGTDGQGNGGSINQIFDAIVADAEARTNAVIKSQSASAPAEGAINRQAPNQVQVDDSQEKMAAAISLVNSGVDFDSAVALVKAASEELEFEYEEQVKEAAFNDLVENGVDADLAVAMIKEASRVQAAKQAIGSAVGAAHAYGKAGVEAVKATGENVARRVGGAYNKAATGLNAKIQAATGATSTKGAYNNAANKLNAKIQSATGATSWKGLGSNAAAHVGRNKAAYGAGAAAAAGGAAYAATREKKAAFDALIDAGIDFVSAAEYVEQL